MFMVLGTWLMGQTQFNVTFTVDMTTAEDFNPETDDVYISGSFADWAQPGTDANYKMTVTEDPMVYTITVAADSGMIQYKFFRVINGEASWDFGEWTGIDNRITLLLLDGLTFNHVWGNRPVLVTFNVDVSPLDTLDTETDKIFITGNFAGWMQPGTIPELEMKAGEDPNIYSVMLSMYKGTYEYKFFIVENNIPSWDGGEWAGGDNRVILVDTAMIVNKLWGDITASIFDNKVEFTYVVYPNPVFDQITLDGVEDVNKVEIYDISGRMVRSIQVDARKVNMNLSDLRPGVYILSVFNKTGVQTTKFIKN